MRPPWRRLRRRPQGAIASEGIDEALREAIENAADKLSSPLVNVAVSPALASHDAASIAGVGWQAEFFAA